jgi:hypothetical protein
MNAIKSSRAISRVSADDGDRASLRDVEFDTTDRPRGFCRISRLISRRAAVWSRNYYKEIGEPLALFTGTESLAS